MRDRIIHNLLGALVRMQPRWGYRFGRRHSERALAARSPVDRRSEAAAAVHWLQQADDEVTRRLGRAKNRFRLLRLQLLRYSRLPMLASSAVEARELDTATRHANALLARADRALNEPQDWPPHAVGIDVLYAEPLFYGHIALGQVALVEGDVASAEQHLLLSAETPGSPELGSFGPTMVLAKELLDQGRTQAVVEYLRRCQRFWKADNGRLDKWIQEIEEGRRPDLRALGDPPAFQPNGKA
jgi:hypothetical protein